MTNFPTFTLPPNARCPICGTPVHVGVIYDGRKVAGCVDCRCFWEPLPKGAPPDLEGKPQPFTKSCDNCAFLKGSKERSDPEIWEGMQLQMACMGSAFYCHKGVPLAQEGDGFKHGFQYPERPDGSADVEKLRLCAGFIAWWLSLRTDEPVPGL